ncbi:hypothetical protein BaRGS_00030061 [Batillaria attramentaria]|uniref:Uncharacterized protein n=1 Tax=Batillaria attramentaria TaxID=370345 RepID=A0ABD0JVD8_9CAEN
METTSSFRTVPVASSPVNNMYEVLQRLFGDEKFVTLAGELVDLLHSALSKHVFGSAAGSEDMDSVIVDMFRSGDEDFKDLLMYVLQKRLFQPPRTAQEQLDLALSILNEPKYLNLILRNPSIEALLASKMTTLATELLSVSDQFTEPSDRIISETEFLRVE